MRLCGDELDCLEAAQNLANEAFGSDSITGALVRAANDSSAPVREVVASALGKSGPVMVDVIPALLGDHEAINAFRRRWQQGSLAIRDCITQAPRGISTPEAIAWLKEISDDAKLRERAAGSKETLQSPVFY